ncbi:MAG: hypothetical protein GXO59_05685 [Dictyoglomi bacterium]|nr:hypothetical protein [Dictyoglomota bacterium]
MDNKNKPILFLITSSLKYLLGLSMIIMASVLFKTMSYLISIKGDIEFIWENCLWCHKVLFYSSTALAIMGVLLILLYLIDKTSDYIPAGIIWATAGLQMGGYIHLSRGKLAFVFIVLFVWWVVERQRQVGRQLGTLQIFMPVALFGPVLTDNKLVWLFSIFFATFLEGVFLMIQGTSEIAWLVTGNDKTSPSEQDVLNVLPTMKRIVGLQIYMLWGYLFITLAEPFLPQLSHIWNSLRIMLFIIYGITWIAMGIVLRHIHRSSGHMLIIATLITTTFLVVAGIYHESYIGLIGAITTFGLVSYISAIVENIFRSYIGVMEFDKYFDTTMSFILLYIVIGGILPWQLIFSYLFTFEHMFFVAIPLLVKMLVIAILVQSASKFIENIQYRFKHEGKIDYNM